MDINYENELYERIKNNDDDNLIFHEKPKPVKKNIKLKSKIISKCFIEKMSVTRFLIILFAFIFIILIIFQTTINLIENETNNKYKILYNIIM